MEITNSRGMFRMNTLWERLCAFVAAASLFFLPMVCPAEDVIAKSASDELLSFVTGAVSKLDEPIIAVIPLKHEDGSNSMEGQLITERLLTELSVASNVRVVEREHLAKALEEQKLASEGFVSPETAARTGKLTGARVILAGTITELGDTVEIHVRLFSVESGEAVAAKKVKARRSIKTFISPLWDDIDRIKSSGEKFSARLWMEADRLRIGDTVKIFFKADRDCYVTVFDFSTDGSITVLFPNRFQTNNKIKGGRKYELPGEDGGYKIRVRGPAGIERLKLFATTEDIQLYERDYSQSPFSTVTDGDQSFARGLQVTMDGLKKTDWAETSCEFLIENVLR